MRSCSATSFFHSFVGIAFLFHRCAPLFSLHQPYRFAVVVFVFLLRCLLLFFRLHHQRGTFPFMKCASWSPSSLYHLIIYIIMRVQVSSVMLYKYPYRHLYALSVDIMHEMRVKSMHTFRFCFAFNFIALFGSPIQYFVVFVLVEDSTGRYSLLISCESQSSQYGRLNDVGPTLRSNNIRTKQYVQCSEKKKTTQTAAIRIQ